VGRQRDGGLFPLRRRTRSIWMHHAGPDRLWWQWQTSSRWTGKNPILSLTGVGPNSAIMDPWANTELDTKGHHQPSATYVVD
jgi:hypothetical protein